MKYLLFGTGDYYERYRKWFAKSDVVALLDNSLSKQNTLIDGIKVLSPEEGIKLDFDVIVILSFYVKVMKAQLLELGVDESRIYHFFDLHKLLAGRKVHRPIQYYGDVENIIQSKNSKCKKILLLSHDLTLGGPALALFHAAEILHNKGYAVVIASMLDGALRQQIVDKNISVVVDENLQIETMREAEWTWDFDLVLCNTISFYVFLSERNLTIPIIWWLHDSAFFYDGVDKELLRRIEPHNLKVASVGPVPKNAMQTFIPELIVDDLIYGVADEKRKWGSVVNHDLIRFTTIGYIENRKGQDILISAIKRLPSEILQKCEFYLIGQNTSLLAQQIKEEIKNIPQILMTGTVDRDEINKWLCSTDMLICPSREDPMPTVAAEAMMHSVPCIISDAVGTTTHIEDGINGLIFPSGNAQALEEKIVWCVEHRDKLQEIGVASRAVYENYFSLEVFEQNISRLVEYVLHIKRI